MLVIRYCLDKRGSERNCFILVTDYLVQNQLLLFINQKLKSELSIPFSQDIPYFLNYFAPLNRPHPYIGA